MQAFRDDLFSTDPGRAGADPYLDSLKHLTGIKPDQLETLKNNVASWDDWPARSA
jgi:hypothetical protein